MTPAAVDPQAIDPATIARAVDVLAAGDVIGLPTETVYGLAADAGRRDAVERIYRINSDELDSTLSGSFLGENALYVIKRDGRNILLLDYERIVQMINPALSEQFHVDSDVAKNVGKKIGDPNSFRILVAEDSPLIRKLIQDSLAQGGFQNVELVGHGKAAWDRLQDEGDVFNLLITDIEMPKMDGLTLTRRVKEDPRLKGTPVIVFSSIMAEDIKRKAQSVGADVQITKPEINLLVDKVCDLLLAAPKDHRS